MYSLALIIFAFSEKKAFEYFPIGFNVNLCPAVVAMGKMFQNASSLKPLGQLKPKCPGMIIGRSSTNYLFFMPIGNRRWPPPQDRTKNLEIVEDRPMNIHVQFGFNNICSSCEEGI
jgi:hypothetical protein